MISGNLLVTEMNNEKKKSAFTAPTKLKSCQLQSTIYLFETKINLNNKQSFMNSFFLRINLSVKVNCIDQYVQLTEKYNY